MMAKLLSALLLNDALMRIRQITDPAKQRFNDNLSLEHLVRIAATRGKDISQSYKKTKKTCKLARDFASKHLAHLDLGHALGDEITSATRGQTTDAIRSICEFVREFHSSVRNADHVLMPITDYANEQQLLLRLYQGNQADKDFEAAALAAALAGDWPALNRADIPRWLSTDDELTDSF